MFTLTNLLIFCGLLHLPLLCAGSLLPRVFDWRTNLQTLPPFLRKLMWVYYGFIGGSLLGFGVLTVLFAPALAGGAPLARALCGYLAIFWAARLGVQLFVFGGCPVQGSRWMTLGYHACTATFALLATIYAWTAIQTGV